MNITNIVDAVSEQVDYPKVTIKHILSVATQVVAGSLEECNSVTIRGLGYFSVKELPPRKIYNPRMNKVIMSVGTKKVIFKQSPTIKIKNG